VSSVVQLLIQISGDGMLVYNVGPKQKKKEKKKKPVILRKKKQFSSNLLWG
jgi:hypothetical protein